MYFLTILQQWKHVNTVFNATQFYFSKCFVKQYQRVDHDGQYNKMSVYNSLEILSGS